MRSPKSCPQIVSLKCILSDIDAFTFVSGLCFFKPNNITHSSIISIDKIVNVIDEILIINY
ncbi:hypothetical protein LguiB_000885 [Lonicera macranthoides]